jgi:phosphoglycolate phosphatase
MSVANNQPQMVLIDLDGTLIDSVPDLAYCVDALMAQLGLPARGEAKVRQWVGNGIERLVKRALLDQLDGEPDPALLAKALPIYLELYKENLSKRSCLYPGVKEGLQFLHDAGYKLGCITNKAAAFTEPLLKDLGIYDYFQIVVSGDTLPVKKPDPLPLLHAARFFKVEPSHALMVGDSISDVKAARAAGFQVICMSYGYNHGQDISDAHPDAVIDSMAQLSGLLAEVA